MNLGFGNDPKKDRKFNMIKQSMDYDSNGFLNSSSYKDPKSTPWILSQGALSSAQIRLGENHPNPVVVAPEWRRHQKRKVKLMNEE